MMLLSEEAAPQTLTTAEVALPYTELMIDFAVDDLVGLSISTVPCDYHLC